MRILNITHQLPYPPITGAPLRSFNLLKRVSAEHEVWLVTFINDTTRIEDVSRLKELCADVLLEPSQKLGALARPLELVRFGLRGIPLDLRLYHSDSLSKKINLLASQVDFDIVQIEHSFMARYLESLPTQARAKTTLMLHDVNYLKFDRISRIERRLARKLRLWVYARMMRRWEPEYAQHFDRVFTVSESDKQILTRARPRLAIEVIPNGIDVHEFAQSPITNSTPSLIFVGNMNYPPNVDAISSFCHDSLPIVRQHFPDVELWVVGVNPAAEVRSLSSDVIHVTGKVDDVRPYYRRATVSVVPLRAGGGTRLKILESMAVGRPVVSTAIGCEGLSVRDGEHLLVADDPAEFARRTISLLSDASLRRRITANARALAVARYSWGSIAGKLCRCYEELRLEKSEPFRSHVS